MRRYEPKIVVITGGESGIGRALAVRLADAGSSVIVADLAGACVTESSSRVGAKIQFERVDVSLEDEVALLFKKIDSSHASLDLVINCAGIATTGEALDISSRSWREVLSVNLLGTIHVSLAAYEIMRRKGGGDILTLGSMSAFLFPPLFAPYVTSKAAVFGFARSLSVEAEAQNVHVSVACPGNIDTPMLMVGSSRFSPRPYQRMRQRIES